MKHIIRTHPKDSLMALARNVGLFTTYVRHHPEFHSVLLERKIRSYSYTEIFNNVDGARDRFESIWRFGRRGGPIRAVLNEGLAGEIRYLGDADIDCTEGIEDILNSFPNLRNDFALATRTLWNDEVKAVQFQLLSHHHEKSYYDKTAITGTLHYDARDTIHIHLGGAGMESSNLDLRKTPNLKIFGSTALPEDAIQSLNDDDFTSLESGDFYYFRGSKTGNPNAHRRTSLEKIIETKGRLAVAAYQIF